MAYTTIDNPVEYFNTVLHTGDGASPKSITGFGFNPEFVWVKARSQAYGHSISDIVRGANKTLRSESTSSEVSDDAFGNLTSFITDGYTATSGSSSINYYNQSSTTYASWGWKANGAGVANTDGTISSTVSANTTSGFSIVSYTGTGSNATVGHGLGVAPSMIIIKARSATESWTVYNKNLTSAAYNLTLNDTSAEANNPTHFNSTAPTNLVFSVGTSGRVNVNSQTQIAYCFAEVKGFSKAFSYTGNGSTDGTFVYTGFKPAFILIKRTNTTSTWHLSDNKRIGYNPLNYRLQPNTSNTEYTGVEIYHDMLSNGFKCRATDTDTNGSGSTYVGFAFAENPFVSSTGIPTTAR